MSRLRQLTRSAAVGLLRHRLERESFPRLQMTLMVALTGAVGLLCSFCLLHLGLHTMAWRYPLAVAAAYAFFLVMLWWWLRARLDGLADAPDVIGNLAGNLPDNILQPGPSVFSGGGGEFGGGGASASFGNEATAVPGSVLDAPSSSSIGDTVGDAVGAVADGDEIVIPLLVLALLLGLALASFYVVYSAPTLLAELLLDGGLSYSLYRRLRQAERQHWLHTAFRQTVIPFAVTALFVMLVGWALGEWAPGAWTIGQALAQAQSGL